MGDLDKIILTSAFTIVGGVVVYVAGQLLSKFLIEPMHELKKTIGDVRFNLAFHAPTIHTPIGRTPERSEMAHDALLRNSCELLTYVDAIPFYRALSVISFGFLPSKQQVREAAIQLRGLSTYVHETGDKAESHLEVIGSRVKKIESCLNLGGLE